MSPVAALMHVTSAFMPRPFLRRGLAGREREEDCYGREVKRKKRWRKEVESCGALKGWNKMLCKCGHEDLEADRLKDR